MQTNEKDYLCPISISQTNPSADRVQNTPPIHDSFYQLLSSKQTLPKKVYLAFLKSIESQLIHSSLIQDSQLKPEECLLVPLDPKGDTQCQVMRFKRDHLVEFELFGSPVWMTLEDSEQFENLVTESKNTILCLNKHLSVLANYFIQLDQSTKEQDQEIMQLNSQLNKQESILQEAERQFTKSNKKQKAY